MKVEAGVDIAAVECVRPEDIATRVPKKESEGPNRGQHWVAANGGKIYNFGNNLTIFDR